ncbi:hypothetical protein CYMTET_51020 [Cymbomonas tetramitiformis]|uniref:Uncharacterized protein n=1 Tax=Cymbomonas tetramitiformis TaxID=36881 RepID=A0AAE0BNN3_9CHLO|nr:hypothetical protein CYMTET_51020 [Cymbomonas tetramitiformis]
MNCIALKATSLAARKPETASLFRPKSHSVPRLSKRTARTSVCSSSQERRNGAVDSEQVLEVQRRNLIAGVALLSSGVLQLETAETARALENPQQLGDGYQKFFGQATSASSYGGYGGSDVSELSSYKYYYEIPTTWTPASVNKQDKGYNGVDSRWFDPEIKAKTKKAYLVTFAGYAKLKPNKEDIIEDLSLADAVLQDALILAEDFTFNEFEKNGQLYVDYDILGEEYNVLCRVTAYGGRIYSMFVWGSGKDYESDGASLRRIRDSFGTIERDPAEVKADLEYYRRAT